MSCIWRRNRQDVRCEIFHLLAELDGLFSKDAHVGRDRGFRWQQDDFDAAPLDLVQQLRQRRLRCAARLSLFGQGPAQDVVLDLEARVLAGEIGQVGVLQERALRRLRHCRARPPAEPPPVATRVPRQKLRGKCVARA